MKKTKRWRREAIDQTVWLKWFDGLTDETIAARLGISRRTLARWKHRPEYLDGWKYLMERWHWERANDRSRRGRLFHPDPPVTPIPLRGKLP